LAELQLRLFGYPQLLCDGEPVPIRRRKALALLAYLATTGAGHSRDVLATLLWPEHEASRAFAFLRNALWILNNTPLADWLVATRHTISLRHGEGLTVDVGQFREGLAGGTGDAAGGTDTAHADRLARAESLYTAGFLEGFSIEDSEPFEDWQFSEDAALRQELAACLQHLIEWNERSEKMDEVARLARRSIDLQPLDETAHRKLMEVLARSGRRAEALAQFDACVEALAAELHLEPSASTTSLADRIRSGDFEAGTTSTGPRRSRTRLPSFRSPLIARETELKRTVDLLTRGSARILTITGPGGAGKTRLAVAAASEAASAFDDGVVFVPLASTSSAGLAPLEVAETLGLPTLRETHGEAPSDRAAGHGFDHLLDGLRSRRMLLVLDNMEHLLEDLDWIVSLCEEAPEVTLLTTSRHPLDLTDEWILPLEGLPVPASDAEEEEASASGAVALFLQAARQADVSYVPDRADWPSIARITRLLDGIPLGIELAASWIRTMSPTAIAREVEQTLDFVSSSRRDGPRRHRSLRAAFGQSWNLLPNESRQALRRLSVFRGGFTAEAAQRVAGATLPVLSSLVAHSLLRRAGTDRYEMLEAVRQYAAERLRVVPEHAATASDAHARFYLEFVAVQEASLKRASQRQAVETIALEIENVRTAWTRAIERRLTEPITRAAMALFLYCDMRNHFDEGDEFFAAAVRDLPEAQTEAERLLAGYVHGFHAWFARMRKRGSSSEAIFHRSLEILEPLGERRELAFIRLLWAFSGYASHATRTEVLRRALAVFERNELPWEMAETLEALAWSVHEDDPEAAIEMASRSAATHEALGDPWGIALAKYTLGMLRSFVKDYPGARADLLESLELRRENDLDPIGAIYCTVALGRISQETGDPEESTSWYERALTSAEDLDATWAQAWAQEALANLHAEAGDKGSATAFATAARDLYASGDAADSVERCERLLEQLSRM